MSQINQQRKILAIETSCDETGFCLLEANGTYPDLSVRVLASELATQAEEHREYGGVFPSLAKRLHAENAPLLLHRLFKEQETTAVEISKDKKTQVHRWLARHPDLAEHLIQRAETDGLPDLDSVAVTVGPGLQPALWVGINIARSIALFLDIPIIPINHMEGHVISALAEKNIADGSVHTLASITYPALALLVSGGHTELVEIHSWQQYEKIGQTRDDAAGEAFDKVGRLLGLDYPAGPAVSRLAEIYRNTSGDQMPVTSLPRPMIDTDNLDFSFSGLKTAAARAIEKITNLNNTKKQALACELEDAIVDVLIKKSRKGLKKTDAKHLLVGGGVSANTELRRRLKKELPDTTLHLSPPSLSGDNAIMIALAAAGRADSGLPATSGSLAANSNLSL